MSIQYTSFVRKLFCTGELDKDVQRDIINDLAPANHGVPNSDEPAQLTRRLLEKALDVNVGYKLVTRFVPPYCTSVIFYSPRIGFVTVSRLNCNFNSQIDPIGAYHVTRAACETIEAAYNDIVSENQRSKGSHKQALQLGSTWNKNTVYLRVEGEPPDEKCSYQPHYTSAERSNVCAACGPMPEPKQQHFRLHWVAKLFHGICMNSKVEFGKGPASVMNDILYKTHDGEYAHNVHIINGELSAHLCGLGRVAAFLNLSWTSAIIAAILALATTTTLSDSTGKIIASAVLGGLLVFQVCWTYLFSSTNFENIASNDIRLRNIRQASTLFGLSFKQFKLLLAMVSPWKRITAHGEYNSYIDISDTGVLELTDPEPLALVYLAGYITTSLQTASNSYDTLPLAIWVPYDTYRVVYGSNERVRRFSYADGTYHLSGSQRSQIVRQDGCLVLKHDSDTLSLPTDLQVYYHDDAAIG